MYECWLYTATIFSSVSFRYVRIFSVYNISANMAIKVEVQHIQNWSNSEAYTITSGNGHIIYWREGCFAISIYISFFLYCMAHSHRSIYIDQLEKKMHGMPHFAQITWFDLFSLYLLEMLSTLLEILEILFMDKLVRKLHTITAFSYWYDYGLFLNIFQSHI